MCCCSARASRPTPYVAAPPALIYPPETCLSHIYPPSICLDPLTKNLSYSLTSQGEWQTLSKPRPCSPLLNAARPSRLHRQSSHTAFAGRHLPNGSEPSKQTQPCVLWLQRRLSLTAPLLLYAGQDGSAGGLAWRHRQGRGGAGLRYRLRCALEAYRQD